MRNWGLVITVFYALVVVLLLVPVAVYFGVGFDASGWTGFNVHLREAYTTWFTWLIVAVPVIGEGLLLFLRVDTSQKRLKPRTHILVSSVTSAFFLGLLTFAGVLGIGVALRGDKFLPEGTGIVAGSIGVAWVLWAIIFYRIHHDNVDVVSRALTWLLRGSVLELLIAVPAHVIVRRRQDCSAPVATSFGITTGIAVMLLAFGPSVLLLYKKRIEEHSMKAATWH
jgi:hypothetical protein